MSKIDIEVRLALDFFSPFKKALNVYHSLSVYSAHFKTTPGILYLRSSMLINVPFELNIYLGQNSSFLESMRHSGARKTACFSDYVVCSPASEVILYHVLV